MILDIVYVVLAVFTKAIRNDERKKAITNKLFNRYMNADTNPRRIVNETYDILSDSEAVENVFKFKV